LTPRTCYLRKSKARKEKRYKLKPGRNLAWEKKIRSIIRDIYLMYKIKAYQNKEIVSRHVSIDYNKRRNPDQKRRYQAEGQPV
jgi:hypothetical protein